MTAAWELLFLLLIPGLFGLVVLMNWLETYLTQQLVADDVAIAWRSTDSPDDLEQRIGDILRNVMVDAR